MTINTITEEQWKKLKQETLNTALNILETVDVLVEHLQQRFNVKASVPIICTALYTHCIEECGKLFYLRSLIPNQGLVNIDDNKFKNHKPKFEWALDCLPERCTKLHEGSFNNNFSSSFDIDTIANWETRLNILNTDFYDNGEIKRYPDIDPDRLQGAIFDFRTILYSVKTD